MTTFMHKFFGWLPSEARLHINPDGSAGAIVAVSARIADGLTLSASIEVGPNASIGDGVSIGDGEWWITTGPQGSRNAILTSVQKPDGLRWWVGCKQGITTDQFRALIAKTHGDPVTNAGCCQAPSPPEHYDDYCIRQFAKLMSEKMAASRAKGRSGWHDPEKCSVEYLRSLLYEHLDKGDPVDVANFCMMLRHYNASTYREFCNCTPKPTP